MRACADGLHDDVGAVAAGQFADLVDALLAALGDDIGGAELAAEAGAVRVASHEDDLLGAEPPGGQDGHRPTAPSPITATRLRGPTPPTTAAWWPVPRTSASVSSDAMSE